MCIYLLMKKFLNIYLLSLENKMKTPYRKLTIKRGVNVFEIFEIISVAVKILRRKSNKYFSQKVNTVRDKTDFLALHPYFWTKVLVRNSTWNISVSSSMLKRLHRSFGSFCFHGLDSFYHLHCFYLAFRFYRLQCFYHAFSFYRSFWVSFRTIFRLVVLGIQECSCICSIYDIHPWNISQDLHSYLVINHRKFDFTNVSQNWIGYSQWSF